MISFCVRKQLEKVISWQIGIKTDFAVSVGKSAKYIYKWIPEEEYKDYLSTYSCGTVDECWKSVFKMVSMFADVARYVAEELGYHYNSDEEKSCIEFLEIVHKLPKTADEIC